MNRLQVIASLMLAIFITSMVISTEAAARGRTGSHRYGGYTSHGKGSHYYGGR
jgi:hypothetical protein